MAEPIEQKSARALDWEPNQAKHGQYCGIQGAHSLGRGKKGDCTCGRDDLVRECANAVEQLNIVAKEVRDLRRENTTCHLDLMELKRDVERWKTRFMRLKEEFESEE